MQDNSWLVDLYHFVVYLINNSIRGKFVCTDLL